MGRAGVVVVVVAAAVGSIVGIVVVVVEAVDMMDVAVVVAVVDMCGLLVVADSMASAEGVQSSGMVPDGVRRGDLGVAVASR